MYEYDLVEARKVAKDLAELTVFVNEKASQGWELAFSDSAVLYFRRPVVPDESS